MINILSFKIFVSKMFELAFDFIILTVQIILKAICAISINEI